MKKSNNIKNRTRFISGMLVLCMTMLTMTGCGTSKEGTAEERPTIVLAKPIWSDLPADAPANELVRQAICDKFNVNLIVAGQQFPNDQDELPRTMISGGEQVDIINSVNWMQYVEDGSIIPLNDLLESNGQDIMNTVLDGSLDLRTIDGEIWAVPYEQNPVSTCLLMRGDWLEDIGAEVPTTIDEYEEVMIKLKTEKNDVGYVPVYGELDDVFAGAFVENGSMNWIGEDGKAMPAELADGYQAYLEKMADWYKKGILNPEISAMDFQQAYDLFYGGQASSAVNWLNSLEYCNNMGLASDENFSLVGVPPLSGEKDNFYQSMQNRGWGLVITSSCKNPELAMDIINYISAVDEGFLLTCYGVEGKQWDWTDKEKGILGFDGIDDDMRLPGAGTETALSGSWLVNTVNKYSTSLTDKEFIAWLNDSSKVAYKEAVDAKVPYDVSAMKSVDIQTALNTIFSTAKWEIITGIRPASDWSAVIEEWLAAGGEQYIDDCTAQYNAAQK